MRTTLKRGIGQTIGLNGNGNGHSAAPPLFGPITRYRQPDPPHRSLIGVVLRGFAWLVLAIAVVAAGAGGGLYLYTHESVAALKATDKATANAKTRLHELASPSQPAIALIAGYDFRVGQGTKSLSGSNSDTLMLVRADPTNHTLSLLSFPRDLYVPVYCRGNLVYTHDRINSAWSTCPGNNGPSATLDTVEHLTHLPINYLITLDFHAFKQLVNRLHGVYMNVDQRYFIAPHTGTSAINLHPGYQKLDGGQALAYVRFRHYDSDIYRTGRQQLFIEALKSRLKTQLSLSNLPLEVPQLIGVLKHNLEYVKAGGGQVSLKELESYLGIAYHLPPGHLFRNQIPLADFHYFITNGGASVESAPSGAIAAAVQSFLHPDISEPQRVDAQLTGRTKTPKAKKKHPLAKSQVSVLVLNAGTVPGEASNTSYLLTQHGYTTKTLPSDLQANAPKVQRATTVYYDPVQPNAKQAAEQLRPLFGASSTVAQMTTGIADFARQAGNPLTVVAVGSSFGGKLVVAPHRAKLPPALPPKVSPGLSVTAPGLRGQTSKLHFPVYAPHRIAQYAQLSSDEGIRRFKPLRNRHELVMTFVNGLTHWQIEETDWTSAPILANPTSTIPWHHHKLFLYTTGGAIQMVVLRTPKAAYMVVNSILNELSNSTMLAIAKSLQPLGR
jgi:LCP family protein required for cell wall assembly